MPEALAGIAFAFGSAIANGSFSVLSKIGPVTHAQVSPYVFNFWAGGAVALSGVVASCFIPAGQIITPIGLISGALFVVAVGSSFVAISLLGSVATATGIWCGVAMCTSYFSGILTGESLNQYLSTLALLIMMCSVYRLSKTTQLSGGQMNASGGHEGHELLEVTDSFDGSAAGILAAMFAGVAGGLILFPMKFVPQEIQGLPYVCSMSVGVLSATPLCFLMQRLSPLGLSGMRQFRVAAAPGILSGIIWNFGNICSIIATKHVGLSVAYPIMQCGLFVAAIWGIALFDEMRGVRLRFVLDSFLLISGVCLLGLSYQLA